MAKKNRSLVHQEKLVFHSGRGVQFACDAFRKGLEKSKNIIQSMSSTAKHITNAKCDKNQWVKGNCWDNTVAQSFFKTLKTELIYHNKYKTKKELRSVCFWVNKTWYNKKEDIAI